MNTSPPYRAAAGASLAVLAVYVATLAPSVTFWDAGELIAAAHGLGIPHPPGTPVYVILAHVWGMLIPFGDYAWRLNLLSAVCGSLAAGCWFLVTHALMRRIDPDAPARIVRLAAWTAAAFTAFSFTNWQNAVEAEVYAVAMLTIALAAWCAVRWSELRDERRGPRLLLMLLFLGAMSIGNHLLALLVGPAVLVFLGAESWRNPRLDSARRHTERARLAVVGAAWLLLIAVGLGSTVLSGIGAVLVMSALAWAFSRKQRAFAVMAVVLIVVGISPYLFLLLRARQAPFINEADPSTLDALLAVIRRAQYPIRTPLDDPTVFHGPDNPGRTFTILGYQLANYAQYFDWQWARTLGDQALTLWPRIVMSAAAIWLGLTGLVAVWRRDRSAWLLLVTLFGVTGLGLVCYMNFKPGPSIGWNRWVALADHEVRERDYFFVVSFVAWGVAMALGLGAIVRRTARRWPDARWPIALFAIAAIPLIGNIRDASRRHGPDATLARDFARALLQSVPPGGILFTWGDNDTFPLWHAQEVDGVRRDVTIVCLALAETDWYQRQLRDAAPIPVDRARLAAVWADVPDPIWPGPVHGLDDAAIQSYRPQLADRDYELPLPGIGTLSIPKGSELYARDMLLLSVVSTNAGHRPIAWSASAIQKLYGAPVVQQGLAVVLPVDTGMAGALGHSLAMVGDAIPIDITVTQGLMDHEWQFGDLLRRSLVALDPNIGAMARTVALPYTRLGVARLGQGDTLAAIHDLEIAAHLSPGNSGIDAFLAGLKASAP